jgi:hypothetical protein
VIGVTSAAGSALLLAMKATLLLHIRSHILMTLDAEFVLGCLVERYVATLALILYLGMTSDDLTGHERGFERLGRDRLGKIHEHRAHQENHELGKAFIG